MKPIYQYRAQVERVIDADTLKLRVDLGFGVWIVVTLRVRGVDAPELRTTEGDVAKAAVVALLTDAEVVVVTYKDQQSFARWVGDVYLEDGTLFADWLRVKGLV